jgi:hypothetical protein
VWAQQSLAPTSESPYAVTLDTKNSFGFFLLHGSQPLVEASFGEWGNRAGWTAGPQSHGIFSDGKLSITGNSIFDKTNLLTHAVDMTLSSPNSVIWHCELSAGKRDVSYSLLALEWSLLGAREGQVTLTNQIGVEKKFSIPLREGVLENISKIAFDLPGSGQMALVPGNPMYVMMHNGDIYLRLGGNGWGNPSEVLAAGSKKSISLSLTLPEKVSFLPSDQFVKTMADASWFPSQVNGLNQPSSSAIGMADWLDAPAGKHGGVREVGDHFQFEDGTKVQFWGGVLSYVSALAPQKSDADLMVAFWTRYGVNSVRFFDAALPPWRGLGDTKDTTKFDPKLLDRFDYFTAQLASHGIYYRLSPVWGFPVLPANKNQVLGYDDISRRAEGLGTGSLINFAEDVQDLMIQKVVDLLSHVNPYTNKSYALDPALCSLEIQNEDDIFWYATESAFKANPLYAKKLTGRYVAWLKLRYSSQDGLQSAWGNALGKAEKLDSGDIKLEVAPYLFSNPQGPGRRRLLDNALFLHQVQDQFYSKYVKAMRATGYQGPIYGSNWQAPEMLPAYYNLRSDAEIGMIDRHNYFGGNGRTCFATMLTFPCSGLLSSGLQQVAGRPFGLSEWAEFYPDCYRAEAPPLIAAYGMGLQGWAACYQEQFSVCQQPPPSYIKGDRMAFMTPMDTMVGMLLPGGNVQASTPTQIGQYPLLARMIYRGDVKQGDVISSRNVSESELEEGQFSFKDAYTQGADIKDFSGGSVPPAALAAGRCLIDFTDQTKPSMLPDMSKYQQGTVITSNTGQLKWDSSGNGFFTINTAGTKAVVGFAQGKPQVLGDVTIMSQTPYASIILTATNKNATLENDTSSILCAVARECNTGFTYSALDNSVLKNGCPPILLEPVQASVVIKNRHIQAVNVLDQNGVRTDKVILVRDNAFSIDTSRDKTIYYEVVFR